MGSGVGSGQWYDMLDMLLRQYSKWWLGMGLNIEPSPPNSAWLVLWVIGVVPTEYTVLG